MTVKPDSRQTTVSAHRKSVDEYFRSEPQYWEEIYKLDTLYARIHQERQSFVLGLADKLRLPPEAHILDVGCGPGVTSVALAARGYKVHAVDSVHEMLEGAKHCAANRGVADSLQTVQATINRLPFDDNRFSLVLAISVLPWLDSLREAVAEIVRVTKVGGYLIVNTDNPWRLHELLDPRLHPLHASVRHRLRKLMGSAKLPFARRCSRRELDGLLQDLVCVKLDTKMLGFGPFSFFGRKLFSEQLNIKLHGVLQHCSDRRVPVIRATGAQYIVLIQKARGLDRGKH